MTGPLLDLSGPEEAGKSSLPTGHTSSLAGKGFQLRQCASGGEKEEAGSQHLLGLGECVGPSFPVWDVGGEELRP